MSLTRRNKHLFALLFAMGLTGCNANAASNAVPVEVWRGGDDGLTVRFAETIEGAFRKSEKFVLSGGRKQGTLVVTIPGHVEWKKIGNKSQVVYRIEFTSPDSQRLGFSTGSCWEDELSECANRVVRDAEIVTNRTHKEVRGLASAASE